MRRAAILAAVLAAAACSRQPLDSDAPRPRKSALQQAALGVSAAPACAELIPSHWGLSFPVPALQDGKLIYRGFFYAWSGDGGRGEVSGPAGEASFDASGAVFECKRGDAAPATVPAPAAPGATAEEIVEAERKLYFAIEDVAALYAAGKPLTPAEKKRVAAFAAEFSAREVPAHAGAYQALSPGFWDWVARNQSRS